jgi:hypothetical protein
MDDKTIAATLHNFNAIRAQLLDTHEPTYVQPALVDITAGLILVCALLRELGESLDEISLTLDRMS